MRNLGLDFWKDRRVLLTGHNGFKGTWASIILNALGAKVYGIALPVENDTSLFIEANMTDKIEIDCNLDIRNLRALTDFFKSVDPEIILHFAAQPLVRQSYLSPIETLQTNILGTANVFEASRDLINLKSIVCVTSDKCYKNDERIWPYREVDQLGGDDPYSASKACAEIIAQSYWHSFFRDSEVNISTVRAGNVIGGGDYSKDRIIKDIVHCISRDMPLYLRNPTATRPWQHVIEPIYGYLLLVEHQNNNHSGQFTTYNFGPELTNVKSVKDLSMAAIAAWGTTIKIDLDLVENFHEAQTLGLDSSKAKIDLGWKPIWNFEKTVSKTIEWYKCRMNGQDPYELCLENLKSYGDK